MELPMSRIRFPAVLLSMPLGPYAENAWRRNWTLGGAAFGALAGPVRERCAAAPKGHADG